MGLCIDIYKDIKTNQLVRIKRESYLGRSMYDLIARGESTVIYFYNCPITNKLKDLDFHVSIPLDDWIKETSRETPEIKKKSITLGKYLELKNMNKIIVKTIFTFETGYNDLETLMKKYKCKSEKDLLEKLKKTNLWENRNPRNAFISLVCDKNPKVITKIIKQ